METRSDFSCAYPRPHQPRHFNARIGLLPSRSLVNRQSRVDLIATSRGSGPMIVAETRKITKAAARRSTVRPRNLRHRSPVCSSHADGDLLPSRRSLLGPGAPDVNSSETKGRSDLGVLRVPADSPLPTGSPARSGWRSVLRVRKAASVTPVAETRVGGNHVDRDHGGHSHPRGGRAHLRAGRVGHPGRLGRRGHQGRAPRARGRHAGPGLERRHAVNGRRARPARALQPGEEEHRHRRQY